MIKDEISILIDTKEAWYNTFIMIDNKKISAEVSEITFKVKRDEINQIIAIAKIDGVFEKLIFGLADFKIEAKANIMLKEQGILNENDF